MLLSRLTQLMHRSPGALGSSTLARSSSSLSHSRSGDVAAHLHREVDAPQRLWLSLSWDTHAKNGHAQQLGQHESRCAERVTLERQPRLQAAQHFERATNGLHALGCRRALEIAFQPCNPVCAEQLSVYLLVFLHPLPVVLHHLHMGTALSCRAGPTH